MKSIVRGFYPVVIDIETTGLDAKENGMLEISAVLLTCDDNKKFEIISKITERQKKSKKQITNIDGVRVSEKDGWWLLRASNTQPAIVLRCESLTEKGLQFQKRTVKNELSELDACGPKTYGELIKKRISNSISQS